MIRQRSAVLPAGSSVLSGDSLIKPAAAGSPFEAARIGCCAFTAQGPAYLRFITRLAARVAARIVHDRRPCTLAVTRLIRAGSAATMAQAGWIVISRGGAVTDRG